MTLESQTFNVLQEHPAAFGFGATLAPTLGPFSNQLGFLGSETLC